MVVSGDVRSMRTWRVSSGSIVPAHTSRIGRCSLFDGGYVVLGVSYRNCLERAT